MKKEVEKLNIRLQHDHIVTTLNVQKVTASGVIVSPHERGKILTRQTVLAAGPTSGVRVGEEVEINTNKFLRKFTTPKNGIGSDIEEVVPPIEEILGKPYLFLSTREIKYIYESPIDTSNQEKPYSELVKRDTCNCTNDKPC